MSILFIDINTIFYNICFFEIIMNPNINTLSMDLTLFIHQYKTVDFLSFSKFIQKFNEDKNHDNSLNILLLFFLILKNDNLFYSQVKNITFIFDKSYKLGLIVLKSLNISNDIQSDFFNNVIKFTKTKFFETTNFKQFLFDISVLFSEHQYESLFFDKKLSVMSILHSKNCIESYKNLSFSYNQKRELFNESILTFRVSSIFILDDLYVNHSHFFTNKKMITYMNIFSQCNFKNDIFEILKKSSNKLAFKLGANLSFTSFSNEELIDFFDELFLFDQFVFYLMSSGFISNPKQNFPEVTNFLKKKIYYHSLLNRLKSTHDNKSKKLKI